MGRATVLGVLAAAAALAAAPVAAAPAGARVHVVRCPTTFGAGGTHSAPSRVAVSAAAAAAGLLAYSDTAAYLLGPPGLHCAGIVAADGGSQILAWRSGTQPPAHHAAIGGLSLQIETACAACRADAACPFFPAVASGLGFACADTVSAGETVTRPRAGVALFTDAPHRPGTGWPSGGDYRSHGVVGAAGSVRNGLIYRATCTLPPSDRAQCRLVVADAIARYG